MDNAEFRSYALVEAELEDGRTMKGYTWLRTSGQYSTHMEDLHPDGIGYYMDFVDVFEPDEDEYELEDRGFEPTLEECEKHNIDSYKGLVVKEVLNIIEADWELAELWQ